MASDIIVRVPNDDSLDAAPLTQSGYPYASSRPSFTANEGIPWRRVLGILNRHWKVSLGFILVVELAIAALAFSLDYTYESRATIEVEAPTASANTLGNQAVSEPEQQEYLGTQTEILKGDGLALGVIQELHLSNNPIFLKQSWIEKGPARAISWITHSQNSAPSDTERLLQIYGSHLSVGEVRNSRLIEIRYESYDPQLSSKIVSTAVRQYLETTHRSKYEATLRAAQSLAPELNEMKKAADQSSQTVLDFQRAHTGVELGAVGNSGDGTSSTGTSTGNPISVRVAQLNQQLTEAMGERLHQESYMALLDRGDNDALPQMKDDLVLQGLTTRIADARAQMAQALSVYGSNNPQIRKLEFQARELDTQLTSQREHIANEIRAAYSSAVGREELISKTLRDMKGALDTANASSAQYDTLKREHEANSNLYVALSSRIKEMAISGSLNANNIRVVDEARIPEQPAGPHRVRILAMGLMFGLMGGIGLAFVAEGMDDTISSVDDLRGCSRLPALALVPRVRERVHVPGALLPAFQSRPLTKAKGLKVFGDLPRSPEAESIRNLATAIRLSAISDHRRVQTVLITSSFPGEGKTTVAANLAIALSRHGRTCLIDGDFRHPAITSYFGLSSGPGLQDLLLTSLPLQDVCIPLADTPGLVVLGVGKRRVEALDMLTSQRMRGLTDELRKVFEYIVFDSPPIIPFSDARWLSKLSDGSVLVARSSETTRRAMMWSVDILEELHAPLLGIVLNGVDLQSEYYSYGIDHYSRA